MSKAYEPIKKSVEVFSAKWKDGLLVYLDLRTTIGTTTVRKQFGFKRGFYYWSILEKTLEELLTSENAMHREIGRQLAELKAKGADGYNALD